MDRLHNITDGVYAIVITILVFDLHAPESSGLTETSLLSDLHKQIPNFIAYLISFLMIALFWMRHHWVFKYLEKCDYKTFMLNFVHLLFVCLIPYTASLIGRYEENPIAVILFSGAFGLAGLSLLFLHRYFVTKTEWHGENADKEWTNPNWWKTYPGPLFALGSILISFININAAIAIWLLLPVWAFFSTRIGSQRQ